MGVDSREEEFKAVLDKFGAKKKDVMEDEPESDISGITLHEQAFVLRYMDFVASGVSALKARRESFSQVWFGKKFDDLDAEKQSIARVDSWKLWQSVQKNIGGIASLASFMGLDQLRILTEAERLLSAKRTIGLDKQGNPIEGEDGGTQIRALELLFRAFGHLDPKFADQGGVNININLNRDKSKLYGSDNVVVYEPDGTGVSDE